MNREYILAKLKELKPYLFEKYGISEVGLFGSYARGDYDDNSDIDILVEYSKVISFFTLMDCIDDLQSAFGKKIDICQKKNIKEFFKKNILQEVIYV